MFDLSSRRSGSRLLTPSGSHTLRRRLHAVTHAVTHVANVAWPAPGLCFRMVYSRFNGYPIRCPTPPRWSGTFVTPKGDRWAVEACDEHVGDIHRPRSGSARP